MTTATNQLKALGYHLTVAVNPGGAEYWWSAPGSNRHAPNIARSGWTSGGRKDIEREAEDAARDLLGAIERGPL